MNTMGTSVDVSNLGSLLAMFALMPEELDKAIKRTATKAGRIIKKTAKSKAPNRKSTVKIGGKTYRLYGYSGALKRSIDAHVMKPGAKKLVARSYRWAMAWSAYVGAARKYKQKVFVRWYKPRKNKPTRTNFLMDVRPVWYSHLVEKGFVAKIFGTAKRVVVPARPFLRPALDSNANQMENLTVQELQAQIDKLPKVIASGGRRR